MRVRFKGFPGRGQESSAVDPLEQGYSELLLQQANPAAHCGLGEMEDRPRIGETVRPCNGNKSLDLVPFHDNQLS